MLQFYEAFPEAPIVHTLSAQLSWSHFKQLIIMSDPLQREFYAQMCRIERWSVRELASRIDSSNDPVYEVYDGVMVQDDFLNAVTAIKTVD